MKAINVETIMDTIYSDVIMESTRRMLDLHDETPDAQKPVIEEQWAEFLAKVIEITMETTVQATVDHLIMQESSCESEYGSDEEDDGVLYS